MFSNLERAVQTFTVEAVSVDFIYKSSLRPLGELPTFLNDKRRNFLRFDQVEVQPVAKDRLTAGVRRDYMIVNRDKLLLISLLLPEEAGRVQFLDTKRPVVFYMGPFVVQGNLHVNADTSDDDLLDDSRDFYPLSDASIFPVQAVASAPTRKVPLLFVNRPLVQAYHAHGQS